MLGIRSTGRGGREANGEREEEDVVVEGDEHEEEEREDDEEGGKEENELGRVEDNLDCCDAKEGFADSGRLFPFDWKLP